MQKLDVKPPSDNNLIHRAISPVPKFWRKVRSLMATIGGVSAGVMATASSFPPEIVKAASYGLTVGLIGTILAQLTKK